MGMVGQVWSFATPYTGGTHLSFARVTPRAGARCTQALRIQGGSEWSAGRALLLLVITDKLDEAPLLGDVHIDHVLRRPDPVVLLGPCACDVAPVHYVVQPLHA
jgi:hypothetical protein